MTDLQNINTREQYLQWRAEWKSQYKALSKEIRALKYQTKNAFRMEEWRNAHSLLCEQHRASARATHMLETLKEAKLHAAERRSKALEEA